MTRDPLALAMFAAWLNVTPEQVPEVCRAHLCDATMAGWKRVGDAAVAWVRNHPERIA